MKFLVVLSLLLLLCSMLCCPRICQATDYYVTPTDTSNPDCPVGEPCFTFDQYAKEFSNTSYFNGKHNITLIFLQGTHRLLGEDFVANHSNSLILKGVSDEVILLLQESNIIVLSPVKKVVFKSLRLGNLNIHCYSFPPSPLLVSVIQPTAKTKIVVERVVFTGTIFEVYSNSSSTGHLEVFESKFVYSNIALYVSNSSHAQTFNISILSSSFHSNFGIFLASSIYILGENTSIALQIHDTTIQDKGLNRPVSVCYDPALADSPTPLSVGIRISLTGVYLSTINITNTFSQALDDVALGIFIYKSKGLIDVQITNSTFSNQRGEGLYVSINDADLVPNINFTMKGCKVVNNTLNSTGLTTTTASAGISIKSDASDVTNSLQNIRILIKNSTFFNNYADKASAVISLLRIAHVTIHNCHFLNNTGSPIMAYQSTFALSGNVSFLGNTAVKGGALSLTLSTVNISNGSNVVFSNNSATDVGGAIYVEQLSPNLYLDNDEETATQCFYQLLGDTESVSEHYSLTFANNTAMNGGHHVFGTSLQSYCIAGYIYAYNVEPITSHDAQKYFYFQSNQSLTMSPVSSLPTRVCLCDSDGLFNCSNVSQIFHNVRAAPGEEFNISAVIVGGQFGTARGSVYAQFLPTNKHKAYLSQQFQYIQGIRDHNTCTLLSYSVLSANKKEVVVLTATERTVTAKGDADTLQKFVDTFEETGVIPPQLLTTPVYIDVTMLRCPMGFVRGGSPPRCDCYEIFKENYISCRLSGGGNGYVNRNGTLWVNASFDEEGNPAGVFVHKYCPFGYCDPQHMNVNLSNPNIQCAFNRYGTLCGACKQGYSTVLGSSKCFQCSNRYLSLLLVFAVAGILLILFIKLLDLTVAHGTINGLIFYANIVWANQSILFPSDGRGATLILKTFIAWLNLDFGIETCFFDGLNGYWKTWLQFVFPFYIWSIAGVIIITARYSTLLTKLLGNNSVPVLATLFLLSYSKLLRTIIIAMSVTYLVDYPDRYRWAVWSFDGNLKYCGVPHVFLFVFAVVVLLVLWMPYTSVLLSVQMLRMVSERKLFRWVNRMKPIFDAYFSPFKDRYHYWVGVQLVARGILLITFSLTSSNIPAVNYIAMTTVSAALLFYVAQTGRLYKKLYVSFLETSFLLNLVLVGGGALFVNSTEGDKTALIFISVGISFFQFIIILLLHLVCAIKLCYQKFKANVEEYENLETADAFVNDRRQNVTTTHVDRPTLQNPEDYSKFREPLLEEST